MSKPRTHNLTVEGSNFLTLRYFTNLRSNNRGFVVWGKHLPLITVLFIVGLIVMYGYYSPSSYLKSDHSTQTQSQSSQTTISATVAIKGKGKGKQVKIFGFTSPLARVLVTGQAVADSTTSVASGYFSFPATTIYEDTKELCLASHDTDGRTSAPTCFPIYYNEKLYGIGPIILAPTFTTTKSEYAPNEKIQFSGQSIPDRTVRIKMNSEAAGNVLFHMPENNSAINLVSQIEAKTNSQGNFSIDTSSTQPQTQHVYSSTKYQGKNSPKSTTLKIVIIPWWLVILRRFLDLIYKNAILFALIVETLVGLSYLYYLNHRHHPLAIYKQKLLARLGGQIIPYPKRPLAMS